MVSRGAEISSGAVWDSLKPLDYLQNHFRSFIIAKAHLGVKTGSTEVIRKVEEEEEEEQQPATTTATSTAAAAPSTAPSAGSTAGDSGTEDGPATRVSQLPTLPPPLPWNLPAGVDCTTSGVLACECPMGVLDRKDQ